MKDRYLNGVPETLPGVIGIVGSRGPDEERGRPVGWTNHALVPRLVRRILQSNPQVTIISGAAPSGVDHMVAMTCRLLHFCDGEHIKIDPTSVDCGCPHFYEFEAQWRKDGKFNKLAGFERNDKLVRHVGLLIAMFAPGEMTPGTSDAVRRARAYDIPVLVYHEGAWRG